MLNFIKEAIIALETKNENLLIIEKTTKELKATKIELNSVKNKIEKINFEINNKEKNLQYLIEQERLYLERKLKHEQESNYLTNKIETLVMQHQKMVKENEKLDNKIDKKEQYINNLNLEIQYLESIEDPIIKKRKGAARLCSVLKQYSQKLQNVDNIPSVLRFSYPFKLQPNFLYRDTTIKESESQNIKENELIEPKITKEVEGLIERFVMNHNCFILIIPGVVDYLIYNYLTDEYTNSFDRNLFVFHRKLAQNLYKEHISVFFKLLGVKGFQIEGNEGVYLNALKEKAMKKNYEELEDEFQQLYRFNPEKDTIDSVIQMFIKIIDTEYSDFKYLGFLAYFLVDRGFIDSCFDLDDLNDLVKEEYEKHKVLKLGESLYETEKPEYQNIFNQDIESMSGQEFENFIVELLQNLGFRAQLTKASGDQGVDVIAKKQGKKYAIQTKRYSSAVGNKAIQEVVAGKEYYEADVSWVITNSTFTKSARELADKTNTLLWDGEKIKKMIELVNI